MISSATGSGTCCSATPLSCTGTTTNLGAISTDGNPELTYTLYAADNTTLLGTFAATPPKSTISDLVAGTYYVHVVANSGFALSGGSVFPFKLVLDPVTCVGTQQTPVLTVVQPTCTPNPANLPNIKSSPFTTALAEVQGTISIPLNPNMTFTINGSGVGSPSQTIEPDGTVLLTNTSGDPTNRTGKLRLNVFLGGGDEFLFKFDTGTAFAVPEPTSATLILGMAALAFARRPHRRASRMV